jgi:hypothetical protein
MRLRSFLNALIILGALAMPAAAQAPTPATTAYDGKYVGTATVTAGPYAESCSAIKSMDMTIAGGRVVIHQTGLSGPGPTYRGSINAAGEVFASFEDPQPSNGPTIITVSGTIHNNSFKGVKMRGRYCHFNVEMESMPTMPTMPFDGWYSGVSREVFDSGSNGHTCDPRALGPPPALKIENGVIGIPGVRSIWVGTVSPQGGVVIRSPLFSRVDGQIDPQGTLRAQYSGEIPFRLGGGTNCIVKFVWQKE